MWTRIRLGFGLKSGSQLKVEEVIETGDEDSAAVEHASRDKVREMEGGEKGMVEPQLSESESLDEMQEKQEQAWETAEKEAT